MSPSVGGAGWSVVGGACVVGAVVGGCVGSVVMVVGAGVVGSTGAVVVGGAGGGARVVGWLVAVVCGAVVVGSVGVAVVTIVTVAAGCGLSPRVAQV